MMQRDVETIESLKRESAKLRKINAALMSRVERSMDQQFNAFSLFETAIALDRQVSNRTQQLREALHSIERTNESLYRAKQQAEAASSLKSSVLISVTHDLLQPLNAARLTLSTFAETVKSDNGSVFIEQVDRSLETLEDLLRTLLDISKLDAGALKPDAKAMSLTSVFAPLRQEFTPVAAKRGLSLRIVPSSHAVMSDTMMLRRILQNLLANAIRYTRRGGVVMGCRRKGEQLVISVHDTGPGIPEAQREAIFQEFQRGETSIGAQVGFGLGLSIVRRFATVLGHDLHLDTRLGAGSTFSVTMPRISRTAVSETKDEMQNIDFQFSGLEGAKILLIENDSSSAEAMASLLEKWGCDVAATLSTSDALERIGALGGTPDAIIADLHLENGDTGLEAIDVVRQQIQSNIPAFIVTADYSEDAAREAGRFGLEILKKPIKPAEIRSLLSFLLA